MLGVAFKKDVDDARNSPAERVIELLARRGAEVRYNDPFIPHLTIADGPFLKGGLSLDSVPLSDETIRSADCVVIVTRHSQYDYRRIVELAPLVVDCCNATKKVNPKGKEVVRLGAPTSSEMG